jgi:sugar phosphate isomerase/epimerase
MPDINFRVKFKNLRNYLFLLDQFDVGFEVVLDFNDLDKLNPREINSYKIPHLTFHAPFFDVSIASWNFYVAELSVNILKKTMSVLNDIYLNHVIIHHNYHPYIYAFNEDKFVDNFSENLSKILTICNGKYKILVENVFEINPDVGLKIKRNFLNNDLIGFCFDIGHFNIFSEIGLDYWIESWKNYIYEFHIHDNNGVYDEHLPVGKGKIDFYKLFGLFIPDIITIENSDIKDLSKSYEFIQSIIS